jgi:alkyldihydroxyacetonephosphate synthase
MSVEQLAAKLANIVGATNLSSAPADVTAYGGLAPDLVVWPAAPPEVAAALKTCTELGAALGVAGRGTRVTRHWPVKDERPRVALDTRRMDNVLDVDELALTVHAQCGIQLTRLEDALRRHELTLGPFPPEILGSTLGGALAAPPPEAHSPRVGWLSDACLGLSVAHADGSTIQTRIAPRRATGPDVCRLYLGSRGGLGVITTATLRVHRLPDEHLSLAYSFRSLAAAAAAAARALARGVRPARLEVLGAERASNELGEVGGPLDGVCLVLLAGSPQLISEEHLLLDDTLAAEGATELPQSAASRWWRRPTAEPAQRQEARVGARVLHSRLPEALRAAPSHLKRQALALWLDQFTLQGATLWLGARSAEDGTGAALRAAVLDAGLEPLRLTFPPLFEELRARLDPHETLVVMES